jgi:type IV secretion system protein VirD4
MMLFVSSLGGIMACLCLYKGVSEPIQKIMLTTSQRLLLTGLAISFFSTLWCFLFYLFFHIPLTSVRPWGMLFLIHDANTLNPLAKLIFWGIPAGILGLIGAMVIAPLMQPTWRNLYGNAHWATKSEIKKMGFLNDKGNVIVGAYGNKLLRYALTNHILIFAPSRSGKGVSVVIPNALNWQGSLLATDNKYEIFQYTSGYRASMGNKVYCFSPAHKQNKTHRINPLDYIVRDNPAKCIADIHLILDILITESGEGNKMWSEEARSIALGILLWLMQSNRPFSLGEFSSIVKGGNLDVFLEDIINENIIADDLISMPHAAFLAIQNFLQKAPKEQSGVRSTLTSMLRLWEDPLICAATHSSDIDFREMRKRPITLYLSFGTGQISRLAPLINLIIQLFLNVMLDQLPKADEPIKVLCLLDEINRFGRMDKLKDGFGDLAGYGVHLMPIIQNVGQFYSTYGGRDNTDIFFQNTDLKIGFRQNSETDKTFISKALGNKTVRIKNRSYGTNREGSNYSESLIERPLLSPAEVGEFSQKKQILMTGDGAIQCHKIIYYKDKRFYHKLLPPITIPHVEPKFPIITVKKQQPMMNDNMGSHPKKESEARLIGQAIAETLAPLVQTKNESVRHAVVDRHTDEMLKALADEFEE